jgi:hypothetical protein
MRVTVGAGGGVKACLNASGFLHPPHENEELVVRWTAVLGGVMNLQLRPWILYSPSKRCERDRTMRSVGSKRVYG